MADFIGTTGRDIFTGDTDVDTFIFAPGQLSSADRIDGGSGSAVDVVRFTGPVLLSRPALSGVTGIERIELAGSGSEISLPAGLTADPAASGPAILTVIGGAGDNRIDASSLTFGVDITGGQGRDRLFGTAYDDVFRMAANQLKNDDIIDGGNRTFATPDGNVLILTGSGTVGGLAGVSNIETIVLQDGGVSLSVGAFDNLIRPGLYVRQLDIVGSAGNDTITTSHSDGIVDIDAGGGNDTFRDINTFFPVTGSVIYNFAASELDSGDRIEVLGARRGGLRLIGDGVVTADDLAHVTGLARLLVKADGLVDITLPSTIKAQANRLTVEMESGSLRLDASALTGGGVDVLARSAPGGTYDIKGSAGTDTFTVSLANLANATIAGTGNDELIIATNTGEVITSDRLSSVTGLSRITASSDIEISNAVALANAPLLWIEASGSVDASGITDAGRGVWIHTASDSSSRGAYYGGAGDDTFDITRPGVENSVVGGDGYDTFVVRTQSDFYLADILSGIEHLDLLGQDVNGTNWTFDVTDDMVEQAADRTLTITHAHSVWADEVDNIDNRLIIEGTSSSDSLEGGAGRDVLEGGTGNDTLDGRSGFDRVAYNGASAAVTIDLAIAVQVASGAGRDVLFNFEAVSGSAFNDVLKGDEGRNALIGNAGNDTLIGRAGADTLSGGAGADLLVYEARSDSRMSAYDVVSGFTSQDKVDLRLIDADVVTSGDQAFAFVSAFTQHAGEAVLSYDAVADTTSFLADGNGDGIADFRIDFLGDVHTLTSDFLL